jgi:hypothetical protein
MNKMNVMDTSITYTHIMWGGEFTVVYDSGNYIVTVVEGHEPEEWSAMLNYVGWTHSTKIQWDQFEDYFIPYDPNFIPGRVKHMGA